MKNESLGYVYRLAKESELSAIVNLVYLAAKVLNEI